MKYWDVLNIVLQGNAQGPTAGMPSAWFPSGSGGTGNPDIVPAPFFACVGEGCVEHEGVFYGNFLGTNRLLKCCCDQNASINLTATTYREMIFPSGSWFKEIAEGQGEVGPYGIPITGQIIDYNAATNTTLYFPYEYGANVVNDCTTGQVNDPNYYPAAYAGYTISGSFSATCNSASWSFRAVSPPPSSVTVIVRVSLNWTHDNQNCTTITP